MQSNLQISDALLLSRIQIQYGYRDEKSLERKTNVLKRKYKLAGNCITSLGIYTFFVMTGKEAACEKRLTLVINEKDWEGRKYIRGNSYLDIKKIETMDSVELLAKCKDVQNKLECVGKLCDERFIELQSLTKKVHEARNVLPLHKQNLIRQSLDEAGITEDILRNLGL